MRLEDSFSLQAELAAFLVRPLDYVSDSHCALEPFVTEDVRSLADNVHFRNPMNRAVAKTLGLDRFGMTGEMLERLQTSAHSRLAVLLACSSSDACSTAARHIAASVLSRRISQIVLKPEREAVRRVLGDAAYNTAIREASMLYGPLTLLDDRRSNLWLGDASNAADDAERQFIEFGLLALHGYVRHVEGSLAELFSLRLSSGAEKEAGLSETALDETTRSIILRLMVRKVSAWSTYLA